MFYAYPSIDQFRTVVKSVAQKAAFVGKDEAGEPIYDGTRPKPTVVFSGTVKVHGTNAGITMTKDGQIVAQSRTKALIAPEDNAGFRAFVDALPRQAILDMFFALAEEAVKAEVPGIQRLEGDTDGFYADIPLTIYGEWAGKGIQKGVAVSEVERFFYVFGAKAGDTWLPIDSIPENETLRIFNARKFPTWTLTVDFNDAVQMAEAQNAMGKITEAVENECPVGKRFGVTGIGEGVVWVAAGGGIFKVKGEKHSVSKVTTLASADVEKVKGVQEFVDKVVTSARVDQAISILELEGKVIDQTKTGDIVRWVVGDVKKEEADTMAASGLTEKDVNSAVGAAARKLFFAKLDERAKAA